MVPDKYPEFYNTLKALVEEGRIPMARIDDAVRRILRVKAGMGLLDEGANVMADRRLHASFGSAGASRGRPRRGPPVAGAPEERGQGAAAREGRPHPRRRAQRRRHRQPVRRLDHRVAGQERARSPPAAPRSCRRSADAVSPAAKVTFSADGSGADGAPRRGGRHRRDALRGVAGRSQRPRPRSRGRGHGARRSRSRARAVVVVLVTGRPMILDSILADARCHRGRVAAGHGRGRRGRRAVRRLQADGQAVVLVAALDGAGSRSTWATRSTIRCSRSGTA